MGHGLTKRNGNYSQGFLLVRSSMSACRQYRFRNRTHWDDDEKPAFDGTHGSAASKEAVNEIQKASRSAASSQI